MNRFKFLFIAIFVLIVAAIATLLALKGSQSGEISIASSTYGDAYDEPSGVSAFLSPIRYEYAAAGSDTWESQKPVKAGKYSVRAVSKKAVGKNYTKTASFEIAPREVTFTIESDAVEYGSVPSKISLPLFAGDTLDKDALLFLYDDYVSDKTGVDLNESSIKIMNGADDRSSCYVVRHEKKEMEILKRSIDISLIQEQFTYSGAAVTYSQKASARTEQRLANGDIIRIDGIELKRDGEKVESAVFAGSYEAVVREAHIYKVINGVEVEVTSQYETAFYSTSFVIAKKDVKITTESLQKEYDASPLVKADGYSDTGFAAGDTFSVVSSASIMDCGKTENAILEYMILNQDGVDVRDNYDVKFNFGTLTVLPRKILVTSPDLSVVYDGDWHSLAKADTEDDLFNVVANDAPVTSLLTVDSVKNVVEFTIQNRETKALENKSNFEISYDWGTLEVTAREITVKIESLTKIYDGTPLYASPQNGTVTADDLADGDTLESTQYGVVHRLQDVVTSGGQVVAVTNTSEYSVFCGNEDRTENYTITYVRGTLEVTPRHITIKTKSSEFIYDGAKHSEEGYTVYEGENPTLVLDNSLKVVSVPSFINYTDTKGLTHNNVFTFAISDNYVIDDCDFGTVTIKQRPLTVTTASKEYVYDGTAHSNGEYTATYDGAEGLIGGDTLMLVEKSYFTNVSETLNARENNVCVYRVPTIDGTEDSNYVIGKMLYGTIAITPRPIHVVTASASKVYDGGELKANECIQTYYNDGWEVHDGLLNGDTLTLKTPYAITDVLQSGANRCEFVLTDDNANYYIIAHDYGTLTITPRPIRVATASDSKIYDGGELSKSEYIRVDFVDGDDIKEGEGLVSAEHTLPLKQAYSITNVSQSGDNACTFDVPNANYEIVGYDYGTLSITPRAVKIQVSDMEAVYGEAYEVYPTGDRNFANAETCGLIEGDMLEISVRFIIDPAVFVAGWLPVCWTEEGEIGSYEYVIIFQAAVFGNTEATNYDLTYESGSLTVLQRVLDVWMQDATTFYGEDLQPIEDSNMLYSVGNVYPSGKGNVHKVYGVVSMENGNGLKYINGLLEGDELEVTKVRYYFDAVDDEEHFSAPKNAGTYYIKPYEIFLYTSDGRTVKTTDEEDGEDRDNYLIHYFNWGTLKIMQRPIFVTLNDIESTMYNGEAREYVSGGEAVVRGDTTEEYRSLLKNPEGLVFGEKLNVKVSFNTEPIFSGKYVYTIDIPNCLIEEPNGMGGYQIADEGLENYLITCQDGSFEITKRPVTVRMNDLELIYGAPVAYPTEAIYTVVSEIDFVEDESIYGWTEIDYGYERVHPSVGTYKITGIPKAVNYRYNPEINVIDSYDIIVEEGDLTITPLEKTVSLEKKYATYGDVVDKTKLMWSISGLYTVAWEDVEAHFFQNGEEVMPKNVGLYDIQLIPRFYIWDLEDYDDLSNYIIKYEWRDGYVGEPVGEDGIFKGALEIQKLAVNVTVKSKTVTYGDELGEHDFTCSPELPYGEELSLVAYYEKDGKHIVPKYAGTYGILKVSLYIDHSTRGLLNYEFELEVGTLTIEPRKVQIRLDDLTVKYGEEVRYHSGNKGTDYTIVSGNLVDGDELFIVPAFILKDTSESRPDWGTYTIAHQSYSVLFEGKDTVDGFFVADSYDFTIDTATLTVEKRIIQLTLNSIFDSPIYYDGKAHEYVAGGELIEEDGMAEGEVLLVAVRYFLLELERKEVGAIAGAGTYEYEFDLSASSVEGGGLKGLDNYTIYHSSLQCKVLKRVIMIEYLELEPQTYGDPVYYPETEGNQKDVIAFLPSGEDALVEGEALTVYVIFYRLDDPQKTYNNDSVLPVGEYGINLNGAKVTGGEYANVKNYEISANPASFKVIKRFMMFKLLDVDVDYGEMPQYPQYEGNYQESANEAGYEDVGSLAAGDTLTIIAVEYDGLPERAFVGTYKDVINLVQIQIVSAQGEIVTNCYSVLYSCGDVIVHQREITVTTHGRSFVYDGDAHSDDEYTITYLDNEENALAYDDFSTLREDYLNGGLPSVTEYMNGRFVVNAFYIVIWNGGESVMDNYEITYKYNNIWIDQLILYVKTKSYSKVYDGLPLEVTDGNIESCYYYVDNKVENGRIDGLVKDHSFIFKDSPVIIDVMQMVNSPIQDIVDGEGNSKLFNYSIASYASGIFTVKPREILVYGSSATKVYDGKPLYSPDENYTVLFYPNNDRTRTPLIGAENVLVSGHTFVTMTPYALNADIPTQNNPYMGVVSGTTDVSKNYSILHADGMLTVTQRPVVYEIDDYKMDYCNAPPPTSPTYYVQREGEEEFSGILNDEWDSFTFSLSYVPESGGVAISRFDAGRYKIMLTMFNGAENQNYKFLRVGTGILTIEKAKLVISPKEKYDDYIDPTQVVTMTLEDIQFEDDTALAAGDFIASVAFTRTSLSASENRICASVKIVPGSVLIQDERTKADVGANYELTLYSNVFGFRERTVYYEQCLPSDIPRGPTGRGVLEYTGERYTIADNGSLFKLLSLSDAQSGLWTGVGAFKASTYGLLSCDAAVLKSASVGKDVGVYRDWVTLNAYNKETGNKMSNLYNFVLVMYKDEDTSIEVLANEVNVRISLSLDEEFVQNAATGYTAITGYVESVNGLIALDHELEVFLYKDEDGNVSLYVYIFVPRYKDDKISSRNDKSSLYHVNITFASGIAMNAYLADAWNYPA